MEPKFVWGIRLLLCLAMTGGCAQLAQQKRDFAVQSSQLHINQAIQLSTDYLINNLLDSGQFIYRVNPNYLIQNNQRYNILRHAGTMMALAQAYQHQPSTEVQEALLAANHFLKSRMAPLQERPDLLGVWSLPQDAAGNRPPKIKLGGVGLALVALVAMERVVPGTTSLADLSRLGQFILHMQKSDGSFYSRFIPSQGGRSDRWTSLYYPGEAALGLLMLNDVLPSKQWVAAAARAVAHLIKNRQITTTDHWLLMAAAKLQSLPSYPAEILPNRAILTYTRRVCELIFQEQILYTANPKYVGGYSLDGRTTPTATRIEGLFAALAIIGNDDAALESTIRKSIRKGINFLLNTQLTEGRYAGGIPRAVGRYGHDRRFNRRHGEIRIDYVQHALSAMVQYVRMNAD